jgi:hypothetical protein
MHRKPCTHAKVFIHRIKKSGKEKTSKIFLFGTEEFHRNGTKSSMFLKKKTLAIQMDLAFGFTMLFMTASYCPE